jgi:chorismate mutase
MQFRGVRGATSVDEDSAEAIWAATAELLKILIETNGIDEDDVASVIFTTTPDLTAAYPAKAARDMGWTQVALIGCQEMNVPGGVKQCIRVLIHWNTPKRNAELKHIYLGEAVALRPDLATQTTNNGKEQLKKEF